MPRPSRPTGSFVQQTLDTRYHIDYDWWERANEDMNLYLKQQLCDEHQEFPDEEWEDSTVLDWVDPDSGLVWAVDHLTYMILSHCSKMEGFISERSSLIDSLFRTLLSSANRPMTPVELAERTGRDAKTILGTLSGTTVYKGIRPVVGS